MEVKRGEASVSALLREIAAQMAALPGSETIRVFGSASTRHKRPGDLDVVIWADAGLTQQQRELAKRLLAMAYRHYGSLDVFVWDGSALHVRNAAATGYVFAKHARQLLKAIRTDGKSLKDAINSWNV